MPQRTAGVVLVAILLLLAGCGGTGSQPVTTDGPAVTTSATTGSSLSSTTSPQPNQTPVEMIDGHEDPPSDRLGWENGYWHNESLDIDPDDGLNDSELGAVVNRSMARVEHIRGLEFNRTVPVEVNSREEFQDRMATERSNLSDAQRLHQEIKFEAVFMVGENESAIQTREQNTGANVLGAYSPRNDTIHLVSEDAKNPRVNEVTLSQELFHALQESRFNVSSYTQNTEERHNAKDGLVEGDANYVDHLYDKRCDSGWDCIETVDGGGGGSDQAAQTHIGMLALQLQPYSDGPVFVKGIFQEKGWDGVDEVYDQPPASTEQTIHPEAYPDDEPTNVTVEDQSTEAWTVPEQGESNINYAQFGEAGHFVMLWYPSGLSGEEIISSQHFFKSSDTSELDLYNYSHRYTAGWDGDTLLPYVRNDSTETNETGYVWRSTWDSEADANEFERGYLELLTHHGATLAQDRPDTYRIDSGPFADAFFVRTTGRNVTIVNAPTVEELSAVREGAGEPA